MSSSNKKAEKQAEATFQLKQAQVVAQQEAQARQNQLLELQLQTLNDAQAGNQQIRQLALEQAQAAISGEINPALQSLIDQQRVVASETRRKNLGVGGDTSTPGQESIRAQNEAELNAQSANQRADFTAAVNSFGTGDTALQNNIANILNIQRQKLNTSQSLGQATTNLGKLSQFTGRNDSFGRDIGRAATAGLFSNPAGFQNAQANLKGLGAFIKKVVT